MEIPLVAASEQGGAQTYVIFNNIGVVRKWRRELCFGFFQSKDFSGENHKIVSRKTLERATIEGDSPVGENNFVLSAIYLEYLRAKRTLREAGWTTSQG